MAPSSPLRLPAAALAALLAMAAAAGAQQGDSKTDARYDVSLAGIEVGQARIMIEIDSAAYSAVGSAKVTGIAQIVTDGNGRAGARGAIAKDRLQPSAFALTATGDDKTVEVQFALDKGTAKDVVVSPPPQPRPDRVALTDAHRKGVIDPMSALLMPVAGEPTAPESCVRTLPIFDGATRYDLTLSYDRTEPVKAKGFEGTALVCRVAFKAIAGHREGRKDVEFMQKTRDILVWLVPVAGTRVLVPFRVQVPTRIGTVVVKARMFATDVGLARASAPPAGLTR